MLAGNRWAKCPPLLKYLVRAVSVCWLGACASNEVNEQQVLPACLAAGDYVIEYNEIDNGCETELPAEVVTIRTDGTSASSDQADLEECTNGPVTDVDCVRSFSRECTFPLEDNRTLEATYDYVMDLGEYNGTATVNARIYQGSALAYACRSTFRVSISDL